MDLALSPSLPQDLTLRAEIQDWAPGKLPFLNV
jgi:hypothetical protein